MFFSTKSSCVCVYFNEKYFYKPSAYQEVHPRNTFFQREAGVPIGNASALFRLLTNIHKHLEYSAFFKKKKGLYSILKQFLKLWLSLHRDASKDSTRFRVIRANGYLPPVCFFTRILGSLPKGGGTRNGLHLFSGQKTKCSSLYLTFSDLFSSCLSL